MRHHDRAPARRALVLRSEHLLECCDAGHRSDQATRFLATHLQIARGSVVAEAGCGTGVLAMLAARLGARRVFATDVDDEALALLRQSLAQNRIAGVEPLRGSLLEPIPAGERLDAVVALLPQKPAADRFDLRYAGGADGTALLLALIEQAGARLVPGGRLWLYHHTLAAPAKVEAALTHGFVWRAVAERWRCVARAAYDALAPGMLARLRELVQRGEACAWERGALLVWRARVLEARRR